KLSIFGLSMISAVMHGLGQVIVVAIIYQSIYMFAYFPALVVSGLVSGWLIALISREVLRRIPEREVINHGQ
ncbi:MAG: Gx transporter family protein, partial [Bacilli bacterium]